MSDASSGSSSTITINGFGSVRGGGVFGMSGLRQQFLQLGPWLSTVAPVASTQDFAADRKGVSAREFGLNVPVGACALRACPHLHLS